MTSIKVICRLRPLNKKEIGLGGETCVIFNDKNINVTASEQKYDFSFDRIFGPDSLQEQVFDYAAKPVIEGIIEGYNGTIFAYGQTSSGKTFTMEGLSIDDDKLKGIVPRMMDNIFDLIESAPEELEFTVKCSFLEIYKERINDLLDQSKQNLQVKEDKHKGIFIHNATEIYVNSPSEMKKIMKAGRDNRSVACTGMNERSSRSHSLFILSVWQRNTSNQSKKEGRLFFVDLAGSEKVSKTNVTGQQLEEAKMINKSLSCLGNVINALTSSNKNEYVPYRDSKLTRILQESIGGNSQTTLILACSMCSWNDQETLSTLRFGNRAKSIKNKPMKNEEKSAQELQKLLVQAENKILQQSNLIEQLKNGVSIPIEILADRNKEEENTKAREYNTKEMADMSQILCQKQMEIIQFNETINEMEQEIEELKNNIKRKDLQCIELTHQDDNFQNLIPKLIEQIQDIQLKCEKVIHDHQQNNYNHLRFQKEISKLKLDLKFIQMSKEMQLLIKPEANSNENNQETELCIKKTNIFNLTLKIKQFKIFLKFQKTQNQINNPYKKILVIIKMQYLIQMIYQIKAH